MKREKDAPFFQRFFTFRPIFLIGRVISFGIFFLHMVGTVFATIGAHLMLNFIANFSRNFKISKFIEGGN